MVVSERTFEEVALADPRRKWELHRGRLREKPVMSEPHNVVQIRLGRQLIAQLDFDRCDVRIDMTRVRLADVTYYIPDLCIVPMPGNASLQGRPHGLEVFREPLPLVVEVWSPSTGDYDVDEKLPEYQARGDLEIWRIHPLDLTVTAWRRQPDGGYSEAVYRTGTIELVALPGVTVDLDALFA
jgi:Uma2 family endonuclease